jgi:hypothetical protein
MNDGSWFYCIKCITMYYFFKYSNVNQTLIYLLACWVCVFEFRPVHATFKWFQHQNREKLTMSQKHNRVLSECMNYCCSTELFTLINMHAYISTILTTTIAATPLLAEYPSVTVTLCFKICVPSPHIKHKSPLWYAANAMPGFLSFSTIFLKFCKS